MRTTGTLGKVSVSDFIVNLCLSEFIFRECPNHPPCVLHHLLQSMYLGLCLDVGTILYLPLQLLPHLMLP